MPWWETWLSLCLILVPHIINKPGQDVFQVSSQNFSCINHRLAWLPFVPQIVVIRGFRYILLASDFLINVYSVNDFLHLLETATILEICKAWLHFSALNLCFFMHTLIVCSCMRCPDLISGNRSTLSDSLKICWLCQNRIRRSKTIPTSITATSNIFHTLFKYKS